VEISRDDVCCLEISKHAFRLRSWKHLLLACSFLCIAVGCGGGGGSNGGGGSSQNPAPTLSGVTPNSATAGNAALSLTASGSGFIPSSVIQWNGTALSTTYMSSNSLTAQVPPSNLSSAGTATVAVQNPPPGGGTSTSVSFTIANPTPTISSISPSSRPVGSAALTLTVNGTQFVATSQVLWNGNQAPTSYASATMLSAQIPASDLSSEGTAMVAVRNPAPGGGTSTSLTFTINPPPNTNLSVLDFPGADLVWNPSQQRLYVAAPSGAGANPGGITVVNPITGAIVGTQQLSSAASGLAMSDDSRYLYAVTNTGSMIQRLTLPALTPDIQWSLGTDPSSSAANLAGDIKVQPGAPHTLAVSFGQYGSGAIAVFDDGVKRPTMAGGSLSSLGNSLQWTQDGSHLYAAYTLGNDSPYYSTVSDDALFSMPVSSNGVGAVTTYHSIFRSEGAHLHTDSATGYVYSDWGEVINGSNGIPLGSYRWSRPNGTYFPGPLSVVDSGLKRFYTLLEIREPDGTNAFQIQSFDQTQFQLLSTTVIPNAVGQPTNFIRWGQSGLAFVTNGGSSGSPGKLYILDGGFVNPLDAPDSAAGNRLNPVPTLTAISPLTAIVGSGALTLTVKGRDFVGQPTVYWNGSALLTTMVKSTELSAQVPASLLNSVSQAKVTVSNTANAFPASDPMPFSVNAAAPAGNQISVYETGGNDLVWDAAAGKLYVSMPGMQGDSGDAIAIVDPMTGNVRNSGFVGSEPARLSLSTDGQYLYVALYGENAIKQLTLPTFTVNAAWNLGRSSSFDGPYYALDLQVAPGASQTTAVTLANFNLSPSSAAVVIYDGANPRSTPLPSTRYDYSGLKWGNNSTLYAVDQSIPQSFLVLGVGPSGTILDKHYDRVFNTFSPGIHYDAGTGLVYTDAGQAIQPSNGTIAGTYAASGLVIPDSTLGRVFILGQTSAQTGTSNYTISSFDQANFTAIDSITIQNVVGAPTSFIRWGNNGLAFITRVGSPADFQGVGPGQLYVITGTFVKP
jgi:hypothetical protein